MTMNEELIGRDFDRAELGPVVLDYLAAKTDRSLDARQRIGPQRILDLQFADIDSDPVGSVRRIYDHFGLDLPPALQEAFAAYSGRHVKGEHGVHEYTLDEYGLTEEVVLRRFARYMERFDIPAD